jgi:hypothetical protein
MNNEVVRAGQLVGRKWRWMGSGPRRLRNAIAMSVSLSMVGAVPAAAQQLPEVPPYELLTPNYPDPLARVCICDVPTHVFPDAPWACRRGDGAWISGVVTH